VQVQEYALAEINRIRLIQQQIEQVLKGPKAGAVLGADDVYIILTRVTNDLQTAKEIIKRNLAQ
jgi:hypothetical protein